MDAVFAADGDHDNDAVRGCGGSKSPTGVFSDTSVAEEIPPEDQVFKS